MHKFFTDSSGHQTIILFPNPPLILWVVFLLAAKFVHAAPWHTWLSVLSTLSLVVWAVLELVKGTSPFRRVLGGVVLLFIGFTAVRRLL